MDSEPQAKHAHIHGVLARDADVAVIFRRGPTRSIQCLLWNLATDEVTPGQWLNATLYLDGCDLSPDGLHLVIGAQEYRHKRSKRHNRPNQKEELPIASWTAISRAPYFTEITRWMGDGMSYGGLWVENDALAISPAASNTQEGESDSQPEVLQLITTGAFEARFGSRRRDAQIREGWSDKSKFAIALPGGGIEEVTGYTKSFLNGTLQYLKGSPRRPPHFAVVDAFGAIRFELKVSPSGYGWMDVDHRGRLIYGNRGCLWAWAEFPQGEPTLIADLNGNKFEEVEAPASAREW